MEYKISIICLEKILNHSVWDGYHTKTVLSTSHIAFQDVVDAHAYGANLAVEADDEMRETKPNGVFFIYSEVKKLND